MIPCLSTCDNCVQTKTYINSTQHTGSCKITKIYNNGFHWNDARSSTVQLLSNRWGNEMFYLYVFCFPCDLVRNLVSYLVLTFVYRGNMLLLFSSGPISFLLVGAHTSGARRNRILMARRVEVARPVRTAAHASGARCAPASCTGKVRP